METRSQRQMRQQRPTYPTLQTGSPSAASSIFPSTSSLSSSPGAGGVRSSSMLRQQHQPPHPTSASAPLPSPSSGSRPMHYFDPLAMPQGVTSYPAQQPQPQQQQQQQQQQRIPPNYTDGQYVGQRGNGAAPETAAFLKDVNLVAEAAKRAQMACLERDLGDVGL